MRIDRLLMCAGALIVATACGKLKEAATTTAEDAEYTEATPDVIGLQMELSGDATTEGVSNMYDREGSYGSDEHSGSSDGFGNRRDALTTPGELSKARLRLKGLNEAVKKIVGSVAELIKTAGKSETGDVRTYGPKDYGNATLRLRIKKLGTGKFGWLLDAKAKGADDSTYKIALGGRLARGLVKHRGRGVIGANLDTLNALDATQFPGKGKLMAAFAHVANGKLLIYRLKDFTGNGTDAAASGVFVGHKNTLTGATRIRVRGKWDIGNTPTTAEESNFARLGFVPGIGGRADVLGIGGDLGAITTPVLSAYWVTACWDKVDDEKYRIVRQCSRTSAATAWSCETPAVHESGLATACPNGLASTEPPSAEESSTPEADAPTTDVDAPPTDLPTDF